MTDALVNPPKPGDPSYDLYQKEVTEITTSLASRAKMVEERMNQIPGIQCNEIQGSMEAFPRVDIPNEAWKDARVRRPRRDEVKRHCNVIVPIGLFILSIVSCQGLTDSFRSL